MNKDNFVKNVIHSQSKREYCQTYKFETLKITVTK